MAKWDLEMAWQRRLAIYTPLVDRPHLGVEAGVGIKCRVWGCYQVAEDGDVNPYFVIELENGRCTYAAVDQIQFIRRDDECFA